MNSLSWPLTTALQEICDALMLNRRIRVVIFAGNGRNFSAGLDFGSSDRDVTDVPPPSRYFGQRNFSLTVQKIKNLSQMTIALVHGSTVGVGAQDLHWRKTVSGLKILGLYVATGIATLPTVLATTSSGLLYTKQLILMNQNGVTLQGTFAAEDATQMAGAAEPEVFDVMKNFQSSITQRSKI
ncbi:hypothetical protein HDU93_008339 [Gonapodya sp. JEL0774]|nr:hypothetical protein HDU93_008339 [Gonapodya sp. JEL0774]